MVNVFLLVVGSLFNLPLLFILIIFLLKIKLYEIFETPTHIHMVLELVTGGELFER